MHPQVKAAFLDELEKLAGGFFTSPNTKVVPPGLAEQIAQHLHKHEHAYELGGLGILGTIGLDEMQAHARAHGTGTPEENLSLLGGPAGQGAVDTVGLGVLAAPVAAEMLLKKRGLLHK